MSRLVFHSMYPHMKMPAAGTDIVWDTKLPKRARSFCKPMIDEIRAGAYFYAPIDFEFRYRPSTMWLRAEVDGVRHTAIRHKGVNARADLLISDLFPERSRALQSRMRELAAQAEFPEDLVDDPRYLINDRLLSAISESDAPGGMVIVWLGGTLYTDSSDKILIKGVPNLYEPRDYEVLDAIIESSRWHGWIGSVIRSFAEDRWISVSTRTPFTKAMVLADETELELVPFEQLGEQALVDPLRWSDFDATYARPPGKYLRDMRRGGAWDTEWKSKLDLRPPVRSPQTPREPRPIALDDDSVLTFFTSRLMLVEDRNEAEPSVCIRHNAREARFTGADACELVHELCARPELSAAELAARTSFDTAELRELLQRLVDQGILQPKAATPS